MGNDPNTETERAELRRICLLFGDPRRTADEGINAAARRLCVSPSTLRRWLSGRTRIPKGVATFLRGEAATLLRGEAP